ncbi:hypothetical protein [Dendronalium phyllosphericum]|uniref:hypothetical protein n=1 Tax=Dendronalium phyllosphericum TaxID=2840445 RepID=UPI001BDC60C2|nr:hypothetical protein [Dendronalium phyllosphericum]
MRENNLRLATSASCTDAINRVSTFLLSTQHSELSTQHSALRTQYSQTTVKLRCELRSSAKQRDKF